MKYRPLFPPNKNIRILPKGPIYTIFVHYLVWFKICISVSYILIVLTIWITDTELSSIQLFLEFESLEIGS